MRSAKIRMHLDAQVFSYIAQQAIRHQTMQSIGINVYNHTQKIFYIRK